jgi:hypothetical protein
VLKLLVKGKFHGIFRSIKICDNSETSWKMQNKKQKNLWSKSCSKLIILAHQKSYFWQGKYDFQCTKMITLLQRLDNRFFCFLFCIFQDVTIISNFESYCDFLLSLNELFLLIEKYHKISLL